MHLWSCFTQDFGYVGCYNYLEAHWQVKLVREKSTKGHNIYRHGHILKKHSPLQYVELV
jgi:hypothetical protein